MACESIIEEFSKLGIDYYKEKYIKLEIIKLTENAIIPTRGSSRSAGYDLYSAENIIIPAHGKGLVKTDIQIKLPRGSYGRIAPRSGLSWKYHIDIGAGVVDEDYTGNVGKTLIFVFLITYFIYN